MVSHDAYPNVGTQLLAATAEYLQAKHAADADFPATLTDLRFNEHLILTMTRTDENNPEELPLIPWAPVFYAAGDVDRLVNIMEIIAELILYRVTHPQPQDRSPWPQVEQIAVEIEQHMPLDRAT